MIKKITELLKSVRKSKLLFLCLGLGSTIWFLIRVIPKPSRAGYPCVKTAAPFMSAFVLYLIGLGSTIYIFKEQKGRLFLLKGVLVVVFVGTLLYSFDQSSPSAQMTLVNPSYFKANEPKGIAKGIFPGRVVWVHNPDATNGNMTNTISDYWALDKNCNQTLVDSMLSSGIRRIGGKTNTKQAWDGIFKYFNNLHGKGFVGYTPGEKIAIKINLTNSGQNLQSKDIPKRMDATPQVVLGILFQLIEIVGVAQEDITIGDNYRNFKTLYYDKCHSVYPDVHYIDGDGGDGVEKTVPSGGQLLQFSDGKETSSIPQHYVDADYFINIPCLKSHDTAGISLAAKNHQGSVLNINDAPENQSAFYMHYTFPQNNDKSGQYRHLVDYMGHEQLGGKTLIYIIDGLWAGRSWQGYLEKWQMAPFNNDYPSSIFMSQDAVAIESVGFDFLLAEYLNKSADQKYPYMAGVDDYIKQAADPANWPAGINYDPEGDGTILKSLGVYEHWNNSTDMQYSRNLGTGAGIELVKYLSGSTDQYQGETTGISLPQAIGLKLYPNPFIESLNVEVSKDQNLNLDIYNIKGQLVFKSRLNTKLVWNGISQSGVKLPKGIYLVKLKDGRTGELVKTEKVIYDRQ
jgi:hypothetical protein